MTTTDPRWLQWGLALLLFIGCSNAVEDATSAWKASGHAVGEFKSPAKKDVAGGRCSSGTVAGFEATLCEFDSAEDAKKAEEVGFELVGTSLGSAVAEGKVLLVVADTRKEDPSGRRLNEVIKAFRKQLK